MLGMRDRGDAAELVMRHRGIGFPEAIDWLAELAGIATPSGKPARPRPPARSGPARPAMLTGRPPAGPPARAAGPAGRADRSDPGRCPGVGR